MLISYWLPSAAKGTLLQSQNILNIINIYLVALVSKIQL